MSNDADQRPEISPEELQRRVIYALIRPAVRLACGFGLPLKELGHWVEMAYFHETRDQGLKLDEAARLLHVSRRKAAYLSRELKENFAKFQTEVELPRRIEFMLWAGPMTRGRIAQAVADCSEDEVFDALDALVRQGRVLLRAGRTEVYEVPRTEFRLYRNNWMARIDGLNNLLSNLRNAVYGRFFRDESRAFARTLSFRVRARDFGKLEKFYQETIWETLKALDDAARDDPDAEQVDLSILWAPCGYMAPTSDDSDARGIGESAHDG